MLWRELNVVLSNDNYTENISYNVSILQELYVAETN